MSPSREHSQRLQLRDLAELVTMGALTRASECKHTRYQLAIPLSNACRAERERATWSKRCRTTAQTNTCPYTGTAQRFKVATFLPLESSNQRAVILSELCPNYRATSVARMLCTVSRLAGARGAKDWKAT
jgi:hypothetical protein